MKIPKSKRARRVGTEIQKVVSSSLRQSMSVLFPGVIVSIPEVRVSDDLEFAAIYCSILGVEDRKNIEIEIKRSIPKLRKEAAQALRIRKIPEFRFVWDDTMERADRIEQLLNKIHSSSLPPEEDERGDS